MSDKKTFEIYLIKKVPYLTNALMFLFFISAVVFASLYPIAAGDYASPEMKTFYLENITIIELLFGSAVSTGLFLLLYFLVREKRKGLLIFNSDSLELMLKKEKLLFPFSEICKINCNDSENRHGMPNKRFTMTIETWKNKKIPVRLQHTSDLEKFINKLLSCDQLKIDYTSVALSD